MERVLLAIALTFLVSLFICADALDGIKTGYVKNGLLNYNGEVYRVVKAEVK